MPGPLDDEAKKRVARTFLDGLLGHDWHQMASALTDDAVWSLPGATAVSGIAEGRDAVVERGRAIVERGVRIEIVRLLYGLDNVAVHLHNTGTRGGKTLDENLTTVFTLRGGKIAYLETLISDVPMLDAFFDAS